MIFPAIDIVQWRALVIASLRSDLRSGGLYLQLQRTAWRCRRADQLAGAVRTDGTRRVDPDGRLSGPLPVDDGVRVRPRVRRGVEPAHRVSGHRVVAGGLSPAGVPAGDLADLLRRAADERDGLPLGHHRIVQRRPARRPVHRPSRRRHRRPGGGGGCGGCGADGNARRGGSLRRRAAAGASRKAHGSPLVSAAVLRLRRLRELHDRAHPARRGIRAGSRAAQGMVDARQSGVVVRGLGDACSRPAHGDRRDRCRALGRRAPR